MGSGAWLFRQLLNLIAAQTDKHKIRLCGNDFLQFKNTCLAFLFQ